MVGTATHRDGVLLEDAAVGRGLPRVEQGDAAAGEQRHHMVRIGGDAAHALQVVEGDALAREQHADVAMDVSQEIARMHLVAIRHKQVEGGRRVKQLEGATEDVEPADDAVLLADEVDRAGTGVGHDRGGADVLAGDVLGKRRADEVVGDHVQGDVIHGGPPSWVCCWQVRACPLTPDEAVQGLACFSAGHPRWPCA